MSGGPITCHEGAAYWTGTSDNVWCLLRIGSPDLRKTVVARGLEELGSVAFADGIIHVLGDHWWAAQNLKDGFKQLRAEIPGYGRSCKLRLSNHYGLLLLGSEGGAFTVEYHKCEKQHKEQSSAQPVVLLASPEPPGAVP